MTLEQWCERLLLKYFPVALYRRLPAAYYALNRLRFRFLPRPAMQKETAKAQARRTREGFFEKYCVGRGIDIGYGGDLLCENALGWEIEHGDAHTLPGVTDATFDFAYSSHLLEHMEHPELAVTHWWRVLKPGGYLILYVPDRDLAEQKKTMPSRFNADHKRFYCLEEEALPDTVGLIPFIRRTLPDASIIYGKVCDEGYISRGPEKLPEGEYSIELVARKL